MINEPCSASLARKTLDSISLIITTYNRPDALDWVLGTVSQQSCIPDEVIVADDGSNISTQKIIDKWKHCLPMVVSWIPDSGFRAARSRNMALLKASGDYIIMVDGDCLLPRHFVRNHMRLSKPNSMVSGGRYLFGKDETEQLLSGPFDASLISYQSIKFNSLPLGPIRDLRPKHWKQARTCNLGLWRSDVLRTEGFDENYVGWGKEDSDFVLRLLVNNGLNIRSGRLATCVGHLHHSEHSRLNLVDNQARLTALIDRIEINQNSVQRSVLANL
jgi:glycosyltransferase involved in cell wall biosynthesis